MVISWRTLEPGWNAAERVLASQGRWLVGFSRRFGANGGLECCVSDQTHFRSSVWTGHYSLWRDRQYGKLHRHARRSSNGRVLERDVQAEKRRRALRLSEQAGERILAGPFPRREHGNGKGPCRSYSEQVTSGKGSAGSAPHREGHIRYVRIGPQTTRPPKGGLSSIR